MKIVFAHPKNYFFDVMERKLSERLAGHSLLSWPVGEPAPANDIEVLLVSGTIEAELLVSQKRLALIQTTTAGYDGIDLAAATEAGIWVTYAPADQTDNAVSVAELAVFLMIGASRSMNAALASVHDRSVRMPDRIGLALLGKTACILGLGGIGTALAIRLRAFGMSLIATGSQPGTTADGIRIFARDAFDAAVADADFVIVCVPATQANENLIDARALAAMKPGSILINVARGSIVDEDALVAAIRSFHIAAAGLDVLKTEPAEASNPLIALPQVFVTPHIAGGTDAMLDGTVAFIGKQIDAFTAGRKPTAVLNEPKSPRRTLN